VNIHATRIRRRRRLLTTDPRFAGRHAGLANFLTREATRANATPLRIQDSLVVAVGGTGYAVGDRFAIVGGTFTAQGTGMVTSVAAGVVTAVKRIDPGQYTVTPGAAAVTTVLTGAGDAALTVNTTLSGAVATVTTAELLAGIRSRQNLAATVPTITRARHFRNPRQTDQTYLENGVPVV